jgi:hypothetical protein
LLVSSSNPFSKWPLENVLENLRGQTLRIPEHPMCGKEFGADVEFFSSAQQQQMLELFLREEAIRFLQDRVRRSALPISDKIDLPVRAVPPPWRGILARWPKRLESWQSFDLPDCVEMMLRDHIEQEFAQIRVGNQDSYSGDSGSRKCAAKKHRWNYSQRDHSLFRRLENYEIAALTDAELWNRCRKGLQPDGYTLETFRASMKRIRHKHGFPSSRQLKKLGQPKTIRYGQFVS